MQVASLLNAVTNSIDITLMTTGYHIGLDFLGQFARVIIEGVGILGLGIIVFTLVLKAITLPFDIYQRFSMRKQTLIMRNMKDDLDKLQQQYAGDKKMYNQKMLELQKKNGYSMFGACLPMIVSLIILIVAFQGFRAYADYANVQVFEMMSEQYNAAILEHGASGKDYGEEDLADRVDGETWTEEGVTYTLFEREMTGEDGNPTTVRHLRVQAEDTQKFIYYEYALNKNDPTIYYIDLDRLLASAVYDALLESEKEEIAALPDDQQNKRLLSVVERIGAHAAAEEFHKNGPGFLWIGNVWYPDVSYDNPIPSWSTLTGYSANSGTSKNVTIGDRESQFHLVLPETQYNEKLISELTGEQNAANGYFILIILSVGLMVLSQFISMKSNKESNKYQTVDGRGAMTQKVMLVVMPLIYGLFAFMMSAAFSIYMIVSSVFSILVTLLSNVIIGHVFKKKEEASFKKEHTRTLPWMDKNGKKGSDGKKNKKKK